MCGAVLAFARVPAWETGGVGTSRVASGRRPGWVSDAPRVASKVVISVHTRNHALVWTRETIVRVWPRLNLQLSQKWRAGA